MLRTYEMFIGPFDQAASWDTKGILGMKRFLDRVWGYGNNLKSQISNLKNKEDAHVLRLLHQTIKKVSEDIETMNFNTAISSLMILFNELQKDEHGKKEYFEIFLMLLSPFAPHMSEEIWEILGHKESIMKNSWPKHDEKYFLSDEFEIVIQVNGKVRAKMKIPNNLSENEVLKRALDLEKIAKYAPKEKILKTVYIKNKLLNIVIS